MLLTITGCHTTDNQVSRSLLEADRLYLRNDALGLPASLVCEEQRAGRGEGAAEGRRADLRKCVLETGCRGTLAWHLQSQITGTPEPLQLLKSLFTERKALG